VNVYDDFDNKQISLFPSPHARLFYLIPHENIFLRYGFVPIIIGTMEGLRRPRDDAVMMSQIRHSIQMDKPSITPSHASDALDMSSWCKREIVERRKAKGTAHYCFSSSNHFPFQRFHLLFSLSAFFTFLLFTFFLFYGLDKSENFAALVPCTCFEKHFFIFLFFFFFRISCVEMFFA
jgi:hypothetical protein